MYYNTFIVLRKHTSSADCCSVRMCIPPCMRPAIPIPCGPTSDHRRHSDPLTPSRPSRRAQTTPGTPDHAWHPIPFRQLPRWRSIEL